MWKPGLIVAAGMVMSLTLFTGQAKAALICSSTIELGDSGGTVLNLFTTANLCVHTGDKTFGGFTSDGPGTASTTFSPAAHFGNVTIGFAGSINSNQTRHLDYEVVVDPAAVALGWRIEDLTKDFSLNQAVTPGPAASATLLGHSPDGVFSDISCTRHDPSAGADNCPVHVVFSGVTDLRISQTLTTGANTNVTVLTDTVSQARVSTPEPASLALLGVGLLGLGLAKRKRGV